MATTKKPPWKKPAPRKKASTTLTAASKKRAAARAKKAGRRYPNLVDNMWASQTQSKAKKPDGGAKRKAPRPKSR